MSEQLFLTRYKHIAKKENKIDQANEIAAFSASNIWHTSGGFTGLTDKIRTNMAIVNNMNPHATIVL